jgi:molybdopterin molybdotransferase
VTAPPPLAPAAAALRILSELTRQPPLRIPLDDALGSILAEDTISPLDIPAWTNSAMDGYAARASDVRGASRNTPVRLRVVEDIPAGSFPTRAVGQGECARIFTGAPLPDGADTVVRQEDVVADGEGVPNREVDIQDDRDCGVNIRRAGEDLRKGALALAEGTELGAAELGVLASLAVAHPLVYRRPRVAILGGGDEIVDIDRPEEILSGRKVASSNTHTLMALIRQTGGVPVNLGLMRDTRASVREHLERSADCDLLVTTAGISVGEHDHLRAVIEEIGVVHFWKIRMRPGAPVGFGAVQGVPWIGLPGNPVSTMVTFELFVRPAIRALMGQRLPFRAASEVRIAEPIKLGPRLQHFLRAIVSTRPGHREQSEAISLPEARLTGPQGSGILTSMVKANALLIIPEGQHETQEGAVASALLLDDPHHVALPPW